MPEEKTAIEELRLIYSTVSRDIKDRLDEFRAIRENPDNNKIFEELCFCILSSGVGPRMAEKSISAMGDALHSAPVTELTEMLDGVHKYPDKASYLVTSREYVKTNFDYDLLSKLNGITDRLERRDFIAGNKGIRGIGLVQSSHFLRNIGFTGYAILDKNILNSLYELGYTADSKPATSRKKYIEKENKMFELSEKLGISIDELDLLLWYRKNRKIPR